MTIATAIKTVIDNFADDGRNYTSAEDKLKLIQLNIAFIARYPDLFPFVMRAPVDIVFGTTVLAKGHKLNTVYDLTKLPDADLERVKTFDLDEAFDELAAHWRSYRVKGHSVIPYIPIESIKLVDDRTFAPKLGFRTRYGVIEALPQG